MTQEVRAWWESLDALSKAGAAVVAIFCFGAAVGVFLLRGNVSANTETLRAIVPQVQENTQAIRDQNAKLERLICYSEETAKAASGQPTNYARCTH